MDRTLRQLERQYSINPNRVLKQSIDILRYRLDLIDMDVFIQIINEVIDEMGSEELAMRFSNEEGSYLFGTAEFGYAFAVNGNLIRDGQGNFLPGRREENEEAPAGYALTNMGGDIPSEEAVIPIEYIYDRAASRLNLSRDVVELIGREWGLGEYGYSSKPGDSRIYHRMGRCPNCEHYIAYHDSVGETIECESCEFDIDVLDEITGVLSEAEVCDECGNELDEDNICQECSPDCPECGAGTHQGVCVYHGPVEE